MKNINIIEDPTVDPGMAVADIYLQGQSRPFQISGIAESVLQAAKRAPTIKVDNVPAEAQKPATRPVEQPQTLAPALYGREYVRATVRTKLFDFLYRTNEYQELEAARLKERRLQLRQRNGTMVVDHCLKHQKQLDKLRG